MPNIIDSDMLFRGNVQFTKAIALKAGSVTAASIAAAAGIEASKVQQQHSFSVELFGPAVTITALTKLLATIRGATGTIVAVQAAIVTKATGNDRTVNVDLQKSTGGGAFATVLTSTLEFDDGSDNLTVEDATINTAGLVAGDILRLVITVAGAAGNQALGLIVTVTVREDAD